MGVVNQLCVLLENRPGALAELCSALGKKAVNIVGIQGSGPDKHGPIRLLVSSPEAARKVLAEMNLKFYEEKALGVHLAERPGALGRITRKLAENNINIEYIYGSIEKGSTRALVVLGVSDIEAASKLIR